MEMKAKPVIDGKFWIIEDGVNRVGTLQRDESNKFILVSNKQKAVFKDTKTLEKQFGKNFFVTAKTEIPKESTNEIYGYPTNCIPHNPMYDIKRKLPLFTKSDASKSVYCAGYYAIRFDKGWVRSFCPKLITIQRYDHKGPFKTELELRQVLSNASR
jgi:hypothetical protein